MRPLVIDEKAKAGIERVKAFANMRRFSIQDIQRIIDGKAPAPGDDENYRVEFFHGWKVVYTIEQQPLGLVHHISISVQPVNPKNPYPHPAAVEMILQEFGLPPLQEFLHASEEPFP